MNFEFFIGIDVSKSELDFAVMHGKDQLFHREIVNTPESISSFINELKKLKGFKLEKAVFCMEHTGIYTAHLLSCLHKKKASLCLEPATQIRNSLGNIRGKNDKIDAIRIAEYACKNHEYLTLWAPKRLVIQRLASLATTRARLIKAKNTLTVALAESKSFLPKEILKKDSSLCNPSIKAMESDLQRIDKAVDEIIASDQELTRLFALVTSVSGIGKVTATNIIITTNEFKDFNDPKKYACYSGVAPFAKESGLFKGKASVSHMANKKVKTLLHMSALVAIQHNSDLKEYYRRKVDLDKKNKMSVLNAVRNKLILRIFACVRENKRYEKKYAKLVA